MGIRWARDGGRGHFWNYLISRNVLRIAAYGEKVDTSYMTSAMFPLQDKKAIGRIYHEMFAKVQYLLYISNEGK